MTATGRPGPPVLRRHLHAARPPVLPSARHHPVLRRHPDLRRGGHHRHPAHLVPRFDRLPRHRRHRRAQPALALGRRPAAHGPDRPPEQHGLRIPTAPIRTFLKATWLPWLVITAVGHGHDHLQLQAGLPGQVEHVRAPEWRSERLTGHDRLLRHHAPSSSPFSPGISSGRRRRRGRPRPLPSGHDPPRPQAPRVE